MRPIPPSERGLTRRAALATLACGLAAAPLRAAGGVPQRIVTLDYGIAQTLIALGRPPLAIASAHAWAEWVAEPPLPAGTVNLGLSREVNLELLQQLRPDMILSTPFLERLRGKLERIAPVVSLPVHATGGPALPPVLAATRAIAALLGREQEGEALIASELAAVEAAGQGAASLRDRPLLLASFLDARHLRVYGRNSLFDAILARMGLGNAWQGPTNDWGFTTLGPGDLTSAKDARLVCIEPLPADAANALGQSPVWRALGPTGEGRMLRLPTVLAFGTLPAASRFARLLAEAARV